MNVSTGDVINDFRKRKLGKFYHVRESNFSKVPFPRRDFNIYKGLFDCMGLLRTKKCPMPMNFVWFYHQFLAEIDINFATLFFKA